VRQCGASCTNLRQFGAADKKKEVEAMAKAKTGSSGFDLDLEPLIKAIGVKRIVQTVGVERIVQMAGFRRRFRQLIREKGVEWLLAQMSPEQRRELKEQLT
jgi:hypothetical protein